MNEPDDLAKRRFLALNLVRLAGLAVAMTGLATIAGKLPLPVEAGYVLFVAGMIDALLAPVLLARRWKSPPR